MQGAARKATLASSMSRNAADRGLPAAPKGALAGSAAASGDGGRGTRQGRACETNANEAAERTASAAAPFVYGNTV